MKWYLFVAAACLALLAVAVVTGPNPSYWLGAVYLLVAVWLLRLTKGLP